MWGINQIDADAVIVAVKQRDVSGKRLSSGHHFRIGNTAPNIRESWQQYASINTTGYLRRRECTKYICQTTGLEQREHLRTYM